GEVRSFPDSIIIVDSEPFGGIIIILTSPTILKKGKHAFDSVFNKKEQAPSLASKYSSLDQMH
ncbi:MAG: hypothetical protein AAF598_13450, partial [Bacteroidota bacterium]